MKEGSKKAILVFYNIIKKGQNVAEQDENEDNVVEPIVPVEMRQRTI